MFFGSDDIQDDGVIMDDTDEKQLRLQQAKWESMKIERARKKLKEVWDKCGLAHMNPGAKEVFVTAVQYQELKAAFDRYMKLFHDRRGLQYNPNGTIVYNGPHGMIKIKAR
jgi:hypothetical protein